MNWRLGGLFSIALGWWMFALPAPAYVRAARSLKAMLQDSTSICLARIDQIFPEKPALMLTIQEDLKGKSAQKRLPVVVKLDPKAMNENYVPPILKRLAPDREIILFILDRGETSNCLGFSNGSWFEMVGRLVDKDKKAWSLIYGQPELRKTFKGTTAEMRQVIIDCLSGKRSPPEVEEKESPGFGPEASASKGTRRALSLRGAGPLFAVIPTIGIGGPLAILAILFPTVFGGVLLLFRQWLAFLSVVSVNSTLCLLFLWFGSQLRGSWWGSEAGLWFIMTMVAFFGMLWAWHRQLQSLRAEFSTVASPRTEGIVLWLLALICGAVAVTLIFSRAAFHVTDYLVIVCAFAFAAGVSSRLLGRRLFSWSANPGAFTEGVLLSAVVLSHLVISSLYMTPGTAAGAIQDGAQGASLVKLRWQFNAIDSGAFLSSPLIDGERIYAAAASPTFRVGTLYCLERGTGKKIWEFLGKGELKNMISSPCIADGRLYIGEGFHDDPDCKLWCVDAEGGGLLWSFPTKGQTESSPAVALGKVYFGAGNDGLYCLDARTGKELWRFPPRGIEGRPLRFGAGPTVEGERVYVTSGVDRNKTSIDAGETALFCLDRHTGTLIWKTPTRLPGWGAPAVLKGKIYFGVGNGDVFHDAENHRSGELLCCDALTGQEIWHFAVANGVLDRPVLDDTNVYFGCRSGHVFCLDREDGSKRWERFLDSPIVAAPALAQSRGHTESVFAVATRGKIACLDSKSGNIRWIYDLTPLNPHLSAAPKLARAPSAGAERRQIYVGAGIGDPVSGQAVLYCLEEGANSEK